MEWTVKKIHADTFKIKGEIEIRFTQDEIVSDLRDCLERGLEKERAWMKETLRRIQETKFAKSPKRLLSIKEAAQYLGISPQTLYNRISRSSKNPFPVKPKRVGRHVTFDIEALEKYVSSL